MSKKPTYINHIPSHIFYFQLHTFLNVEKVNKMYFIDKLFVILN